MTQDPFTGSWRFSAGQSTLSTPAPAIWTQEIKVEDTNLSVLETIVRADGNKTILTIKASFDGADYPVEGSPIFDVIAYERPAIDTILGTGKKMEPSH
jgi:hypothetical protein